MNSLLRRLLPLIALLLLGAGAGLLGSDDGARVWLNGQEVFSVNTIRGVQPDQDAIPGLTLRAGKNLLLVKVGQGVGGWGLAARLEGTGGRTIGATTEP
jgi:hypothetical protein